MRIENETVKNIIRAWYEKSKTNTQQPNEIFDQFISLWIAFNAYYAAGKQQASSEYAQLEWVKNDHAELFCTTVKVQADKFKSFKNYIETKDQNKGFIQDLRYEVNEERHKKRYRDLSSVSEYLECIYQIRCNLFHGGKDLVDAQDKKLVEFAHTTLSIFLKEILKQEEIILHT